MDPTEGSYDWFVATILSKLPRNWFPLASPTLGALVGGIANILAWLYAQLAWIKQQSRIATASGIFLDLAAQDYFGFGNFLRNLGESDDSYRARISTKLLAPKVTRAAMVEALTDLSAIPPIIVVPVNPGDCGGYGSLTSPTGGGGFFAYSDGTGCYGSLAQHNQVYITAYRPKGVGIPNMGGYGTLTGNSANMPGCYGSLSTPSSIGGSIAYADMAMVVGPVTDAEIIQTIEETLPVGVQAWVSIAGATAAAA